MRQAEVEGVVIRNGPSVCVFRVLQDADVLPSVEMRRCFGVPLDVLVQLVLGECRLTLVMSR